MKRLVACVATTVAAALLAGCGGTSCTSNTATPQASSGSCTASAGSTATVSVTISCKCTDTSPSCQAEYVNGNLEVGPTVQQCQEQAGCDTSGCPIQSPVATCSAAIPANATSGKVVVNGTDFGTFTVLQGGSGNCTL